MHRRSGIPLEGLDHQPEVEHGHRPLGSQPRRFLEIHARLFVTTHLPHDAPKLLRRHFPVRGKLLCTSQRGLGVVPPLAVYVVGGNAKLCFGIAGPLVEGTRDLFLGEVGPAFHLVHPGHRDSARRPTGSEPADERLAWAFRARPHGVVERGEVDRLVTERIDDLARGCVDRTGEHKTHTGRTPCQDATLSTRTCIQTMKRVEQVPAQDIMQREHTAGCRV